MVDVLQKLREIADRSPEEIARAIKTAEAMSGKTVSEAEDKKLPPWLKDKEEKKDDESSDSEDGEEKKDDKEEVKESVKTIAEQIATLTRRIDELHGKGSLEKIKNYHDTENAFHDNVSNAHLRASEFAKDDDHSDSHSDGAFDHHYKGNEHLKSSKRADALTRQRDAAAKLKQAKADSKKFKTMDPLDLDETVNEDVQITLSGSDAVLAEILRLAGQIGAKSVKGDEPAPVAAPAPMPEPAPMGVPSSGPLPALDTMMGEPSPNTGMDMGLPGLDSQTDDASLGMDDMSMDDTGMDMDMGMDDHVMDDSFSGTTNPDPTFMDTDAMTSGGNDLSKPKLTAPKVSGGDNPMQSQTAFR